MRERERKNDYMHTVQGTDRPSSGLPRKSMCWVLLNDSGSESPSNGAWIGSDVGRKMTTATHTHAPQGEISTHNSAKVGQCSCGVDLVSYLAPVNSRHTWEEWRVCRLDDPCLSCGGYNTPTCCAPESACPCGDLSCDLGADICHSCTYAVEYCDCEVFAWTYAPNVCVLITTATTCQTVPVRNC